MSHPLTAHLRRSPHRVVGAGLFAFAFVVLLVAQGSVGYVRDESVYFAAAESYARWFRLLFTSPLRALSDDGIVRFWSINHEHPVLMKSLFGLSHLLFHQTLGWLDPATAFRLPALAVTSLIPALTYRLGAGVFRRPGVGVIAALSFLLVPRQLFNGVLAAFDMPVAAAWLLVVFAYWKSFESARWGVWTGVAFGLAVSTKHNAFFLPFVLAPFILARAWQAARAEAPAGRTLEYFLLTYASVVVGYGILLVTPGFERNFQLLSPGSTLFVAFVVANVALLRPLERQAPRTHRALLPLAAMSVLAPFLFYLHWPYLWHHPVERTAWYLKFHATHNHYAWLYLGDLLREPPFPLAYVLVVTALTVPTSLLVPMAAGLLGLLGRAVASGSAVLRQKVAPLSAAEMLIGVNAVASIAIISHPSVPHFGGVKHWLPSMPFLALLGGVSLVRTCDWLQATVQHGLKRKLPFGAVAIPLVGLVFLPAAWATLRIHPYGTSYYSELAGGLPGAATLGMQRQFWSSNVTGVLPWINAHAPRGARLFLHEVNAYSFRDYQRNGQLRSDLRMTGGPWDADIAAYQYHHEFREHEFNIWQAFGTTKPVTGLYLDETPQVVVYARPGVLEPGQ